VQATEMIIIMICVQATDMIIMIIYIYVYILHRIKRISSAVTRA